MDKFELAGITPAPAKRVKPPIISECVAHLECKVHEQVEAGECEIFIGEVLEAYCSEELFENGIWSVERTSLPLHLGGRFFAIPQQIIKA